MTRDKAWKIICRHVKNENLRKHMVAVEEALAKYYEYFARNSKFQIPNSKDDWRIVGLLHDFDWEIHPTLKGHPQKGEPILAEEGVPEDLRRAILSHADHTGIERVMLMEKVLYAVDELTGLIVAIALIKEKKLANVTVDSVLKKWKKKDFARGVNREQIENGAKQLGIPLREHINVVLEAMQGAATKLGL